MNGRAQIYRPVTGQVVVKITGRRCSRAQLRGLLGRGVPVTWDPDRKVFLLARHHLEQLIGACVTQFRTVEVIIDTRTTETCTPACAHARPDTWWDCVCSCRAANHGGGTAGHRLVADGEVVILSQETTRTTSRYAHGHPIAARRPAAAVAAGPVRAHRHHRPHTPTHAPGRTA